MKWNIGYWVEKNGTKLRWVFISIDEYFDSVKKVVNVTEPLCEFKLHGVYSCEYGTEVSALRTGELDEESERMHKKVDQYEVLTAGHSGVELIYSEEFEEMLDKFNRGKYCRSK